MTRISTQIQRKTEDHSQTEASHRASWLQRQPIIEIPDGIKWPLDMVEHETDAGPFIHALTRQCSGSKEEAASGTSSRE
jgi:hypothetical protein